MKRDSLQISSVSGTIEFYDGINDTYEKCSFDVGQEVCVALHGSPLRRLTALLRSVIFQNLLQKSLENGEIFCKVLKHL